MTNLLKLAIPFTMSAMALVVGCSNGTGTNGRGAERISCTSGMNVTVACGASGLGSCTGDPILTVCDGARTAPLDCERGTDAAIDSNDDFAPPDRCPSVTVVCPTSGMLSVKPTAFAGIPTCNWEFRESGI